MRHPHPNPPGGEPHTTSHACNRFQQYEKKKAFKAKVTALEQAKTEPELVSALDEITKFVLEQKGLPLGIKKQQLITDIRKVKKTGKENKTWNKEAEISYEQLIYSINYQQVRPWVLVLVFVRVCICVQAFGRNVQSDRPISLLPPVHINSRPTRRATWPTRFNFGY